MQHRPFPFGSALASIVGVSTEPTIGSPLAADEEAFISEACR
jgi:hypothetical protein